MSLRAPVRDAVILAAGNGDRFKNGDHHSKLLHPVAGQPLILRTLETAAAAGLSSFCVVLGFEADRVRATVTANPIPHTTIRFVYNPDWHLENGVRTAVGIHTNGSPLGNSATRITPAIKAQFDPDGILNPGKLLP